jgi:hypothetical protein
VLFVREIVECGIARVPADHETATIALAAWRGPPDHNEELAHAYRPALPITSVRPVCTAIGKFDVRPEFIITTCLTRTSDGACGQALLFGPLPGDLAVIIPLPRDLSQRDRSRSFRDWRTELPL